MRRTILLLASLIIALTIQIGIIQAGTITLAGGWRIEMRYCRNGYTAQGLVIGNVAATNATNNIVVNSINPTPTGQGTIVSVFGTTVVSGPGVFYWSLAQTPGTTASSSISRVENGVVVGTATDNGTIQDCNVAIPPPAPSQQPDNRINPDPVAPVAIYCRAGGVEILSIDGAGNGHFALFATETQINAVGVPARNILITAGGGVGLFRLTSGEFQVNVPTVLTSGGTTTTQPQPTTPITTTTTTTTTNTGNIVHVVQRGENLFRISLRYGVTMSAIASLNGITNFNLIYAGQRLIIPAATTTVVTNAPIVQPTPALSAIGSQAFFAGQDYVFVWDGC